VEECNGDGEEIKHLWLIEINICADARSQDPVEGSAADIMEGSLEFDIQH